MADYSFFDQYSEMEVDLTAYLERLSTSTFKYRFSNTQPVVVKIKDIFTKYELQTDFKQNLDGIIYYTIEENESIDSVAYKIYESADYWWIIAVFNDITNIWNQWPMNQEQLNTMVDLLYTEEGRYSRNTYFNILFEENESKRYIVLPRPDIIGNIIWAYREQIIANV